MRLFWAVELLVYFLKEFFIANLTILREVLTPGLKIKPSILKVPVQLKSDFGLFLLSNMITLTPGTLTLKISDDRKFLFIHMIYSAKQKEDRIREIQEGFERRILRTLGERA